MSIPYRLHGWLTFAHEAALARGWVAARGVEEERGFDVLRNFHRLGDELLVHAEGSMPVSRWEQVALIVEALAAEAFDGVVVCSGFHDERVDDPVAAAGRRRARRGKSPLPADLPQVAPAAAIATCVRGGWLDRWDAAVPDAAATARALWAAWRERALSISELGPHLARLAGAPDGFDVAELVGVLSAWGAAGAHGLNRQRLAIFGACAWSDDVERIVVERLADAEQLRSAAGAIDGPIGAGWRWALIRHGIVDRPVDPEDLDALLGAPYIAAMFAGAERTFPPAWWRAVLDRALVDPSASLVSLPSRALASATAGERVELGLRGPFGVGVALLGADPEAPPLLRARADALAAELKRRPPDDADRLDAIRAPMALRAAIALAALARPAQHELAEGDDALLAEALRHLPAVTFAIDPEVRAAALASLWALLDLVPAARRRALIATVPWSPAHSASASRLPATAARELGRAWATSAEVAARRAGAHLLATLDSRAP